MLVVLLGWPDSHTTFTAAATALWTEPSPEPAPDGATENAISMGVDLFISSMGGRSGRLSHVSPLLACRNARDHPCIDTVHPCSFTKCGSVRHLTPIASHTSGIFGLSRLRGTSWVTTVPP